MIVRGELISNLFHFFISLSLRRRGVAGYARDEQGRDGGKERQRGCQSREQSYEEDLLTSEVVFSISEVEKTTSEGDRSVFINDGGSIAVG